MTIDGHVTEFAGRRVVAWEPVAAETVPATYRSAPTTSATARSLDPRIALRLSVEYESKTGLAEMLGALAASPGAAALEALVIGTWAAEQFDATAEELVAALVAHKDELRGLRALFLGDITGEECEISWLHQGDLAPLFPAFPRLEVLWVRGGDGLAFSSLEHDHLRELVIETGGLPRGVVQAIGTARLPALERLELWLGDENYGGDTTVEDLAPILAGERFPKLRHLGLRNAEHADAVAVAAASAPVIAQLEELDLSMGTLGDVGGEALLASPLVPRLKRLDLSHHYLTPEVAKRLSELPGVVVLADAEGPADDDERYCSVSE